PPDQPSQPAPTSPQELASPNPPSVSAPARTVEKESFIFELAECRRSGTNVLCDLFVTNRIKARALWIGLASHGFDDLGNRIKARSLRIASYAEADQDSGIILEQGIRTRFSLTFSDLSADLSHFSLLMVEAWTQERGLIRRTKSPLAVSFGTVPVRSEGSRQ
ncbi:MAG TPA: hypothetical protein VLQ45_08520, partial [Thermoanaerobaculia bacterium]|nr:hypothetical protein [Thermoanaerobaculia bacterium]